MSLAIPETFQLFQPRQVLISTRSTKQCLGSELLSQRREKPTLGIDKDCQSTLYFPDQMLKSFPDLSIIRPESRLQPGVSVFLDEIQYKGRVVQPHKPHS